MAAGRSAKTRMSDVRRRLISPVRQLSLLVSSTALSTIRDEAARSADGRETGGILLGRESHQRARSEIELTVLHAAGPGPQAVRQMRFFRRDYVHAQQAALDAFALDGSVWVGEWHTHPDGQWRLSQLDVAAYLRHLADPALNLERFLAIVVTPGPSWRGTGRRWANVRLTAWLVTPNGIEGGRI